MDAALAYVDKLKPLGVDAGVTHVDRVARRKEDIKLLQETLHDEAGVESKGLL